jgi:hypothetical protein
MDEMMAQKTEDKQKAKGKRQNLTLTLTLTLTPMADDDAIDQFSNSSNSRTSISYC